MIGGFIFIIWMGHVPLMALIFTIQARSCPAHRSVPARNRRQAPCQLQQWCDLRALCIETLGAGWCHAPHTYDSAKKLSDE